MKKLNVTKLADSEMQKVLMAHMETNMMNLLYNGTINNLWETLCDKVYKTSVDTLGHTTGKHQDWLDDNDAEMLSLLEERRRTHDAFLSQQTRNRKLRYTQKKLRAIQNAKKADELQQLADENSSKGFFAAIKQVYGPQKTAVVPIRDADGSQMLTEKPAIVSRWRDFFQRPTELPSNC